MQDVSHPVELSTTECFALHQSIVGAWLHSVTSTDQPSFNFDYLITSGDLYGVSTDKQADELKADVTRSEQQYPSLASTDLRRTYVGLGALSPYLSLFQKGDLLTRVAQSFDGQVVPANGGKIVNKTLSGHVKTIRKAYEHSNGPASDIARPAISHFEQLATMTEAWKPPMTRRDYYRHAASAISGEKVEGVFKAFGILLAYDEQPSPKEQKRVEERCQKRLPVLIKRADKLHRKL